jgi:hypothetical protein
MLASFGKVSFGKVFNEFLIPQLMVILPASLGSSIGTVEQYTIDVSINNLLL